MGEARDREDDDETPEEREERRSEWAAEMVADAAALVHAAFQRVRAVAGADESEEKIRESAAILADLAAKRCAGADVAAAIDDIRDMLLEAEEDRGEQLAELLRRTAVKPPPAPRGTGTARPAPLSLVSPPIPPAPGPLDG